MQIKLEEHTIEELVNGYKDSAENGVVAFGGKLNVRPAYQREFVYKEKERNAVINTVQQGFPLNVMYWVHDGKGNYELLDGQQRTISICQYCNSDYSLNNRAFHNLTPPERQQILNYKLMIYVCEGDEKEQLDWFKTINIAGVQLSEQELRNAIYTGTWLSDAKRYFSRVNGAAYRLGNKLLSGEFNRQAYLETAISWIADRDGLDSIEAYMSKHQHDLNANDMWLYFQSVIAWVNATFTYRKEMKGVQWGLLYNKYGKANLDPATLEKRIAILMTDDDISTKRGIYYYVLDGEEKHLSIRAFTDSQKRTAYERQQGICPKCNKHFEIQDMQGDHITPWSKGGHTVIENLQMLCADCNRRKSNK